MEDKARVGCTPQRRQQAHRVLPCLIIEHGVITLAERASETALIAPWPSKLTILPGFRPERPGMLHTSPIQSKSAAEPRRRMLMIMMAPLVQRTSNFFFWKKRPNGLQVANSVARGVRRAHRSNGHSK